MDARDATSHGRKKNLVTKRSRYEDAVQAIDEALKIDPKDAAAWISKGIVLIDLGRNDEALRALDESLKLDPKDTVAWTSKATALVNLGRNQDASEQRITRMTPIRMALLPLPFVRFVRFVVSKSFCDWKL